MVGQKVFPPNRIWQASRIGATLEPQWATPGVVAINSDKRRSFEYGGLLNSPSSKTNFMDIEVSKITVIAINMVEGGSAVATSDIILNPVQYLGGSSPQTEAEEKLK